MDYYLLLAIGYVNNYFFHLEKKIESAGQDRQFWQTSLQILGATVNRVSGFKLKSQQLNKEHSKSM